MALQLVTLGEPECTYHPQRQESAVKALLCYIGDSKLALGCVTHSREEPLGRHAIAVLS